MNMAALGGRPGLFVCINNQYGMGTRVDRAAASSDFAARARSFGLEAGESDGADVDAVFAEATRLMDAARGGRPGFLTFDCYRFFGHARMDKSPYRTPEEEAEGRARDPLPKARDGLIADGLRSAADLDVLDDAIAAEMDQALEQAIAAPAPAADALFTDVYAPGEPAPIPLRARIATALAE